MVDLPAGGATFTIHLPKENTNPESGEGISRSFRSWNFEDFSRNFAEFGGNFAKILNSVAILRSCFCEDLEIFAVNLKSQKKFSLIHQKFSKSQKGGNFHCTKVIFLNSPEMLIWFRTFFPAQGNPRSKQFFFQIWKITRSAYSPGGGDSTQIKQGDVYKVLNVRYCDICIDRNWETSGWATQMREASTCSLSLAGHILYLWNYVANSKLKVHIF